MEKVCIIIPSFNESENLSQLIPAITTVYPFCTVIIVEDGDQQSADLLNSSIKILSSNIHIIARNRKKGRGSAVYKGIKYASKLKSFDYFIEMDADFSHKPSQIGQLLKKVNNGTIIIGSRYIKGAQIQNWPLSRKILSFLSNYLAKKVLGIPIHDFTNGFRVYPKSAIRVLLSHKQKCTGYAYLSESAYLLFKAGFKFFEVPITFENRKKGVSKTTLFEFFSSLCALFQIRFR